KKFKPVAETAKDGGKKGEAAAPAETKKDGAAPSGNSNVKVFRNPNWEITLSLEQNDRKQLVISGARSKIKNINPSKRTLALDKAQFRVIQGQAGAVPFRIPAEYLLWNEETPFRNDVVIDKFNKNAAITLEQVFNWYTSPVKRIDALVLGYQSHRTANYALKM